MTKKFIFTIFICLLALSKVWAQSPNMINYQGVALNSGGTAIANQNISIRATVHNLTPTGTILYSEERNLTTETGGLFNFQIGGPGANATVGTWSAINWGTSAKHLQIEMDVMGGTNFVDMGTQQLVSVPYAQYSNLSGGLIPTATITPNQITSVGATTNQVLQFNGSNWVPANVSGGVFSLPYSANVNLPGPLFNLENSGNGDIFYINSLGTGTGLTTTSVDGNSISANSTNGYGLRASSATNYSVVGFSDNGANLFAAIRGFNIGGGAGLHGSSVADNGILGTSSAFGKSGVRGEATGSNSKGVYGNSNQSTGVGVYGNNSSSGEGVYGASATGYGVSGITNSSTGFAGVYGTNTGTAGSGVSGVSHNLNTYGVYGSSNNGTALSGNSTSGYALQTNGNIKISGGNTNPSNGAVLTSDATGNAVWKNDKIAFKSKDILNYPYYAPPSNAEWKLLFSNEQYDFQNNFTSYAGGTPTANSGTFIAPISGLYHFDIAIKFQSALLDDIEESYIILRKQQGLTVTDLDKTEGNYVYGSYSDVDYVNALMSTDVILQAGDKVWVIMYHDSDLGHDASIVNAQISGHLVFAD